MSPRPPGFFAVDIVRLVKPPGGGDFYNNQNTRVGRHFATSVMRAALEGRLSFKEAYALTGLRGGAFQKYARRLGVPLRAESHVNREEGGDSIVCCDGSQMSLDPSLSGALSGERSHLDRREDGIGRWSSGSERRVERAPFDCGRGCLVRAE